MDLIKNNTISPDVVVVGAGISGLVCAQELTQNGVSVQLLEQSDAVGGRIRTDEVEGFLLDRGFQVYLDAYNHAGKILNLEALDLKAFEPGAIVFERKNRYRLMDVFRRPLNLFSSAFSPIGSLKDKVLIAKLRNFLKKSSIAEIQSREDTTTEMYLRNFGFSEDIIDRFFRSFYGGIFLEKKLKTSSRMFEFTFKMFSEGSATLPAKGMEEIPRQLALKLPDNVLRLNTKVAAINGTEITLVSGEKLNPEHIVLAMPSDIVQEKIVSLKLPEIKWRSVTNFYFASKRSPLHEPIIALSGDPNSLVNNVSVPSDLSADYAPAGQSLISVSVLGVHDEEDFLNKVIRELKDWFGNEVKDWRHLRTDRIEKALAEQTPDTLKPKSCIDGISLCGDQQTTTSIEGAIISGQQTARRVIQEIFS